MFYGGIAFYSGEWDARERIASINSSHCLLFMLTGEYDHSVTVEMSEAAAAKLPGAKFQVIPGIGQFPFAEIPRLFANHLLPALATLQQ